MTMCRRWLPRVAAGAGVLINAVLADGQGHYARGQNVVPVFEGWERNADESINMVFGYMNRNYEQEMDIPVGPDNMFSPGPADQGQPEHFYACRQEFVFKVKLPKDWGQKDLVWTLRSAGKIEKAYGSLLPTWELGNLVYQENRKGAGDVTYPEEPNQPPAIEMVGSARRMVAAGEPLSLTVEVTDDGHPVPRVRPIRVARPPDASGIDGPRIENPITQAVVKLDPGVRLGVTWVWYRGGPGTVTFVPTRVPVARAPSPATPAKAEPVSGKATTTVTFGQPGTYQLRGYADDGILTAPVDVIVTVQGKPQP